MRGLKPLTMLLKCPDWKSHLLQMRGLKQDLIPSSTDVGRSHLLQMRGLKPIQAVARRTHLSRIFYRCVDWNLQTKYSSMSIPASHLLQMRGLKPRYTRATAPICVASFTDAWIETRKEGKLPRITPSRIFYRCVDWNLPICKGIFLHFVASFTDAWIETKRH